MRKERAGITTRAYLQRGFHHVIFAAFGLVLLPMLLLLVVQSAAKMRQPEILSAKDRLQSGGEIMVEDVIQSGGSAMVVTRELDVLHLGGKPIQDGSGFSKEEWTRFLIEAGSETGYDYDISYDATRECWLVLRKPRAVSMHVDFSTNREAADYSATISIFIAICTTYLLALLVFVFVYARGKAAKLTKAIEEVSAYAGEVENGHYDAAMGEDGTLEIQKLKAAMRHLTEELKNKEIIQREEEAKRMLLVSEISHDLKNPLAGVQGYSEMLRDGEAKDPAMQREYVQRIYENSSRANRLLQSLFTYSKLGSAGYVPELQRTELCEFTRRIFAEHVPQMERAGLSYELIIPEEEIFTQLNEDLFRRVYDNLIENAIKYSGAETNLRIEIRQKEQIHILISDNGIGIEEDGVEHLFDPFYRGDRASRNSKTGGSGLGLAIVKQVISLHHGQVEYLRDGKPGCKYRIVLEKEI